jgi:hypothetical protein
MFCNKTFVAEFFCNKTSVAIFFCNKTAVAKKFCNKTYVVKIILQQDLCCSSRGALGSLDAANLTARDLADLLTCLKTNLVERVK